MAALSLGRTRPVRPSSGAESALVMTVVHNPEDARIRQRQINALITAGWKVTYVAPFRSFGLEVPLARPADIHHGSLRCLNIPRSAGRRRLRAWRAARTHMRALSQDHDLVLVHDPELVLAAIGLRMKNLIWDVHEDPAAAMQVKSWMPKPLRRPVATAWRRAERVAERQHHLLLAEQSYQARFRHVHPVVANSVSVPRLVAPAGADRVSYLGSVTMSRGCQTMIEVGCQLRRRTNGAVWLEVIGEAADAEAREALQKATESGDIRWLGFLRSEEALARVSGSLAGLCLLRNLPNYRVSLPTKIVEYCALGVPVITTPLPLAVDLLKSEEVGFVVAWDDPHAVVDAILKLRAEAGLRRQLAANGHRVALRDHDWNRLSADFVGVMDAIASQVREEDRHQRCTRGRSRVRSARPQ
jgi:glycosyltransferase involved in cell wall biosynthesis